MRVTGTSRAGQIRGLLAIALVALVLGASGGTVSESSSSKDTSDQGHLTFASGDELVPKNDAPRPSPSDLEAPGEELSEEAKRQIPLIDAVRELEEAAGESRVDGLATINPDFDGNRIHLYWKGTVPSALQGTVERVRERFEVVIHDAPYTWTELDREIKRLQEIIADDATLTFIAALAMEDDVSGIRILLSDPSSPTERAGEVLDAATDVPYRFEFKSYAANVQPAVAGSRWDDQPPFIGGAVIETHFLAFFTDDRCSTAFTVRNEDATVKGVLSAKHCGEYEDWYTPEGGTVGVSNLVLEDRDIMGIMWSKDTLHGYPGFSGRIYHGPHTTSAMGGIGGSGRSIIDELLCANGGYSGTVCNNRVLDRNLYFSGIGGPNLVTRHTSGVAAAGDGDSGGGMYLLGSKLRLARGVISAIDANRPTYLSRYTV